VRTLPAALLARQIPGTKPAPFPAFIEPSWATLRKLESGFDEVDKKRLLARLEPLRTKKPPFAAPRKFPKARWVKPHVLIDAAFRGKTGDAYCVAPHSKECGKI
jgi:ATP-dependent DNA ligase